MPDTVFLACPTYDGRLTAGAAAGLYMQPARKRPVMVWPPQAKSLLANACNLAWCAALNGRATRGLKWFAMLHADIAPPAGWIDTLIDEAEAHDADFVSAVVPIKDQRGMTSTALAHPETEFWPLLRLTQAQVTRPQFPETFDKRGMIEALRALPGELAPRVDRWPGPADTSLLANTGCMVCRLDRPWAARVYFTIRDEIVFFDGGWKPAVFSEDWFFSRGIDRAGGRVMCTKKLALVHAGGAEFPSDRAWGQPRDTECEELNRNREARV